MREGCIGNYMYIVMDRLYVPLSTEWAILVKWLRYEGSGRTGALSATAFRETTLLYFLMAE